MSEWRLKHSVAEIASEYGLAASLTPEEYAALTHDWKFWAHPGQMAPPQPWTTWLILAGRGFGKTRAGAEYARGWAEQDGTSRIALVAPTMADGRDVMVEGESGLIATAPPDFRPVFETSKRRLTWPNGAQAFLYSAEEPEQLRGPQHHFGWGDEIARWPDGERMWSNLQLGLRLGSAPRAIATTTPRPTPFLKALIAAPGTVVTRGRTLDNARNLPPRFLSAVTAQFAGTRLGRQELDGEIIEDIEGALWTRDGLDRCRVDTRPEGVARVIVGVDPPAGAAARSDACGIIVAARGLDGVAYVLADRSVSGLRPEGWARAVAAAAAEFGADKVVAEVNNGGAMVESVLRSVEAVMPVKAVRASHGKVARAEPIAALYEVGRVRHCGPFARLEDELCGLIAGGAYAGPGRLPDRADALVWALHELMLGVTSYHDPVLRNL